MIEEVERSGGRIEVMEISQEADRRNIELTLELPKDEVAHELVSRVADVEHVLGVRWAE